MQVLTTWLRQQIAFSLMMLLVLPAGVAETAFHSAPQTTANSGATQSRSQPVGYDLGDRVSETDAPTIFPDSPGATRAQTADQSQQTAPAQPAQTTQQTPAPQPVGTAVAPYEKPGGSPASRPAGAAIAPAKQHRIRTLSIRVALLVGAGVAIGVVTAASLSSPSRPY